METWGAMKRLAATQTPMKNHQLTLVGKTLKGVNINTQQYSKCWLCGDRDETINHIMSEWGKLAQKDYKTRHDWVGKVILWELCKKKKFDHTTKCYVRKPGFVLENETHKNLWDFKIETDHLISARQPDLGKILKRTCRIMDRKPQWTSE